MEKILFKNEIINTIIGVLLIVFAILAFTLGWITDFFGVIIGVVIILVSMKRFIETFKKLKKKEAAAILVIEIVGDLVCGFVLITSKQQIGLFVGIVFYIRGFAYLLINYLATRRGNLFQYFLNIGFITLGSYLLFGGNTYLNVVEVVIITLIAIAGIVYAAFGIGAIVEKSKKKPKVKKESKVKEPAMAKEPMKEKVPMTFKDPSVEPMNNEKLSMTDAVKKTLPQTEVVPNDIKVEKTSDVEVSPKIDYDLMTVTELKNLCKERGLTNYASLRKNELIDLLK